MHRDPGLEIDGEGARQHPHEIALGGGDRHLADADPEAGPDRRKLRHIAVDPQGEGSAIERWIVLGDRPDCRRLTVISDQIVVPQIVQARGNAAPREIVTMRVETHQDEADALGDQGLLFGADHSDRDIGLALEEIVERVGERQLDREGGMPLPQPGQDRRQVLYSNDLAGADPHRPTDLPQAAFRRAQQRRRSRREKFRERLQFQRGIGRRQTAGRPHEQRDADRFLEGIDVARDAGLRQLKGPRRARERPFPQDGLEGPIDVPAGEGVHLFSYNI